MKIVLVCIGCLQPYIQFSINQLKSHGNHDIVVLTDTKQLRHKLQMLLSNVTILEIQDDELCLQFETHSSLSSDFRNGFFRHCFKRFLYLYYYMRDYNVQDIIHIENDVMVYNNCDNWRSLFTSKIHLIMDSPDRCIPSVMYFKNHNILGKCLEHYNYDSDENDMVFWGKCFQLFQNDIKTLSIHNNFIFDGAAIGQYLGGVNPENVENGQQTIGFINETCVEKYNHHKFKWKYDCNTKLWIPIMNTNTRIQNLHIHSKKLESFLSHLKDFNQLETRLIPIDFDFMSGEKFQNLAHHFLYISNDFRNISEGFIHQQDIRYRHLRRPLLNYSILYINSFELEKFLLCHSIYILNPFVVISTNSDKDFTLNNETLKAIEHPNCLAVFVQNPNSFHHKIRMLPIGIANSKWSHGDINTIRNVLMTKSQNKTNHIYFQFSVDTNIIERSYCKKILQDKIQWSESNLNFYEYLLYLSSHRYAICPVGNGSDSHIIWECIYMQVIPILKQSVFTKHVQKFLHPHPIIIVNEWNEIDPKSLEINYQYPDYPVYNVDFIKNQIDEIIM
jgi:hypothetical protein